MNVVSAIFASFGAGFAFGFFEDSAQLSPSELSSSYGPQFLEVNEASWSFHFSKITMVGIPNAITHFIGLLFSASPTKVRPPNRSELKRLQLVEALRFLEHHRNNADTSLAQSSSAMLEELLAMSLLVPLTSEAHLVRSSKSSSFGSSNDFAEVH